LSRVADHPKQDKDANLPAERIGNRFVTTYQPEIALQIVEKVAEGQTINKICEKGSGMPHPTTFKRWIVNHPELARAMDAARKLSAQSIEEEALDAAREIKKSQRDGTHVRAVEVLLQQLRWSMERRDPAQFGTKAPVNIRVPIQINTTLEMGKDEGSIIEGKSIYTIEARHNVSPQTVIEHVQEADTITPLAESKPIVKKQVKRNPS
jgi:hypothetical protein